MTSHELSHELQTNSSPCSNIQDNEDNMINPLLDTNVIVHRTFDTLVLSGGGSKGISLLGSLHHLYKVDNISLEITKYIGTSVGAIISYLLIVGYLPVDILCYICQSRVLDIMNNPNLFNMFHGRGACDATLLEHSLEDLTVQKLGSVPTMKELYDSTGKELIVCTYNDTKGVPVYIDHKTFPDMSCVTAIRLSSNIPFIFDHYRYKGDFYLDGGIIDNFPIGRVQPGDVALGINLVVKPITICTQDRGARATYTSLINLLKTFFAVRGREHRLDRADINVIDIEDEDLMGSYNLDTISVLDKFSHGYNAVKTFLEVLSRPTTSPTTSPTDSPLEVMTTL